MQLPHSISESHVPVNLPSGVDAITWSPTSTAPVGVAIIALPFRTPLNELVDCGRLLASVIYRKAFSGVVLIRTA